MKQNWFNTLNEALGSENLTEFWPLGINVNYNDTVRLTVETGETYGKRQVPVYLTVSVYRNERGMYERPISYRSH